MSSEFFKHKVLTLLKHHKINSPNIQFDSSCYCKIIVDGELIECKINIPMSKNTRQNAKNMMYATILDKIQNILEIPDEKISKKNKKSKSKSKKKSEIKVLEYPPISHDNIGSKMLMKLGWKHGKGLGVDNQGILEPINVSIRKKRVGL